MIGPLFVQKYAERGRKAKKKEINSSFLNGKFVYVAFFYYLCRRFACAWVTYMSYVSANRPRYTRIIRRKRQYITSNKLIKRNG